MSEVQIRDITECKRGVEWLVRDEIAAAMRSTGPITEETLKMVADHVKNGINESSCKHTSETLNYVFGAEQSHPMFLEVRMWGDDLYVAKILIHVILILS